MSKTLHASRLFLSCLLFAIMNILPSSSVAAEGSDYEHQFSEEVLRSDFEALYRNLKNAHYDLFIHRPQMEYDERYEKVLASLDRPMTLFEAQVQFQKFVSYGNVAHARIDFPDAAYSRFREAGGRSFPVYIRIVDGRSYVGENYSGMKEISSGDEIVEINGRPMSEWLDRTAGHISADTPYIAHSLLEFLFPRILWLELGEMEAFQLTFRPKGGGKQTLTIEALTRDEQISVASSQEPAFNLDFVAREARMLDDSIAYLRPGPFYNAEDPANIWDNSAFIAFIDEAFKEFVERKAKTLIIDLRSNPGGNNSFSDHMIAWFATEPFRFAKTFSVKSSLEAAASNQKRLDVEPGEVNGDSVRLAEHYSETPLGGFFEYEISQTLPRSGVQFAGNVSVLVDRHSYSNAVSVAAIVQDYGFGEVIGEKTSDMATSYAAMEHFDLPGTGIKVGFPKAHIIRPSGDKVADGVTPDFSIESPTVPTADDVVLNAAVRVVMSQE